VTRRVLRSWNICLKITFRKLAIPESLLSCLPTANQTAIVISQEKTSVDCFLPRTNPLAVKQPSRVRQHSSFFGNCL